MSQSRVLGSIASLTAIALTVLACSTPEGPQPATPTSPGEHPARPPSAPVVTDPACAQRPPPVGDDAASAYAWRDYTLRCEPIQPVDPIEGEQIAAMLPYPAGGSGPCIGGSITFETFREGSLTRLVVRDTTTGDCSGLASLSVLSLGNLPVGSYRLEDGSHRATFTVRPSGSDPGALPDATRLALEVARVQTPGQCFGMPPGDMGVPGAAPFAQTRLARQMQKAFPRMSMAELEALSRSASSIGVSPSGADAWTYAYTNGACCTISEVRGELRRGSNGGISVGKPNVVSSKSVPC